MSRGLEAMVRWPITCVTEGERRLATKIVVCWSIRIVVCWNCIDQWCCKVVPGQNFLKNVIVKLKSIKSALGTVSPETTAFESAWHKNSFSFFHFFLFKIHRLLLKSTKILDDFSADPRFSSFSHHFMFQPHLLKSSPNGEANCQMNNSGILISCWLHSDWDDIKHQMFVPDQTHSILIWVIF